MSMISMTSASGWLLKFLGLNGFGEVGEGLDDGRRGVDEVEAAAAGGVTALGSSSSVNVMTSVGSAFLAEGNVSFS